MPTASKIVMSKGDAPLVPPTNTSIIYVKSDGKFYTKDETNTETLLGDPTTILATSITNGDTTHAPDGNSVFDALALKSDISHTHASILASSISDGDTTHAPDGNSIYDALALKSDISHTHPVISSYSTIFYGVRR